MDASSTQYSVIFQERNLPNSMPPPIDIQQLVQKGKQEYASRSYQTAAQAFESAAQAFNSQGDPLSAAEMNNNRSVALLKAGKFQQALDAALGTDLVFAQADDKKRQAMALGNQAAALEELKRLDEALDLYQRSAELFAGIGEGDLRSTVLKSAAAIELKRGRLMGSGMKMIGSLEAKDRPSILDRIMKFILRLGK